MKCIKYIEKIHFDNLIKCGSIRIGTLKDYKEGEHGQMVADSMEGAKRFSGYYKHLTSEDIKSSATLSSMFDIGGGITDLLIENHVIIEPDYYIFSFAQGYSLDDHKEWLDKENYEVAYSIDFPRSFFRKVTRELNKHNAVQFIGLYQVHYYDEKKGMDLFDPRNDYPAFCLKDYDGFSNQKEIRAVWKPLRNEAISPINLNVISLGLCVELEALIPLT
ncbi:hypothetical protein ACK31R_09795 [Aeromonas caviae]